VRGVARPRRWNAWEGARDRSQCRRFGDVRAGERLAHKDLEGKQDEEGGEDRIAPPCKPGLTFNGGNPCSCLHRRTLLCGVELTRFLAHGHNLATGFASLMCGLRSY
jgi:hypothetical protein